MTTYFVGTGGSNANNGSTYALRKLTIQAAENIGLVAGDTVYVAPGTYREAWTCQVSGTAGNPITFIADVTGENTDKVGGVVRVTCSDDDLVASARTNCISALTRNYRTMRGFLVDSATSGYGILTQATNVIIEDCIFTDCYYAVQISGVNARNVIVRRCRLIGNLSSVFIQHSATLNDAGHIIENCEMLYNSVAANIQRVGGVVFRHCTIVGNQYGMAFGAALAAGQKVDVQYSIIAYNGTGLSALNLGDIVENYNNFNINATARSNVAVGANSNAYLTGFKPSMLFAGVRFPPAYPRELADWSALRRLDGSTDVSDDIYGMVRPATESKNSFGALQYNEAQRETTTVHGGVASMKIADAGRLQFFISVNAIPTTISVYVQWQTDYAGTKPQMIIRQPGESAITLTAVGTSGAWELLTSTFTPSADTNYVVVEFVSSNTALAGSYATFWDDLRSE